MAKGIVPLRDVDAAGKVTERGMLEVSTGKLFDAKGNTIGQLDIMGEYDMPLADHAARLYYANVARQVGHPVRMRDADGEGQLIKMDLSPTDVHIDAALPNYAAGYKLAESVADIALPVVLVPKQSDKYNTWDAVNAFRRVLPNASASGGSVAEVNPTKSVDNYSAVEYALGAFIPQNVIANADTPLQPYQAAVKRVMNAIRLEREIRSAVLLQTSANFDSSVVVTLAAGAKWNGGATSDPVADIHNAMEKSAMPVSRIIMSETAEHAFVRNPNTQKYIGFKDSAAPIPAIDKFAALLRLPPITVAPMKYYASGTTLSYVWGSHVVFLHEPPSNPPTDQEEVATGYTFRWNGGNAPDGSYVAGMMVRTYYDPKRGGRGGTQVVVVHNDAEKITSKIAGGLLLNAVQ